MRPQTIEHLVLRGLRTSLGLALLWLSACTTPKSIEVYCYQVGTEPVCNITMEKKGPVATVCWDTVLTCANKTEATLHKCAVADYRKTKQVPLDLSEFIDIERCDAARSIQVRNKAIKKN